MSQLRGDRAPIPLAGRTVIVRMTDRHRVDGPRGLRGGRDAWRRPGDPRSTRGTNEAAASAWRAADEVISLPTPARFVAISEWYDDLSQVTDEEVTLLLGKAAGGPRHR